MTGLQDKAKSPYLSHGKGCIPGVRKGARTRRGSQQAVLPSSESEGREGVGVVKGNEPGVAADPASAGSSEGYGDLTATKARTVPGPKGPVNERGE